MPAKCGVIAKLRGPKILDMSIFDWATSLLGAWLVGRFLLGLTGVGAWVLFILLWVALGVLVHWMLDVPTMLGYYLGISKKPQRNHCA